MHFHSFSMTAGSGADGSPEAPVHRTATKQVAARRLVRRTHWAAPGNCWAQRWPDLRCEAALSDPAGKSYAGLTHTLAARPARVMGRAHQSLL